MSKYTITALAVVIFSLSLLSQSSNAQSSQTSEYLWTVGVQDSLYSTVLQENRTFWVHLPGGMDLNEGQRYPVIYLLDGGALMGGLAAVQEFYNHFRLPEMIVVGISNASSRTLNLTPSEIESRHGALVEESGGAEQFTSFLADELIPMIDSKYPTTSHRVLIGHSYGGLFTINTLVHHSELFSNYVALDPSLDWDDQRWLGSALDAIVSSDMKGKGLFVAVANEIIRFSNLLTVDTVSADTSEFSQGIRSSLSFIDALESSPPQGLRFNWDFYPQDIHGSIPLVGMRDALVYLYDFWELKNPSLYNNPDIPTDTLIALIRAQSQARTENMGYSLPMEEELLEMLAFMSLDSGQPEKARAVLSLAAEYYPESGSLQGSLVDVCLTVEDFLCAETHARMADGIEGGSVHMDRVLNARGSQ